MSYSYIWYIDFAENYVFTKEGRCFNLLTGKQIKQCLYGYTVGYKFKNWGINGSQGTSVLTDDQLKSLLDFLTKHK
jgi:hypothetical protein